MDRPASSSRPLENLISTAQTFGVKVVRYREGDAFEFGGSEVRVIFPPRDRPVGDRAQNSDSMVLSLSYGHSSLLLEGDAQKRTERYVPGVFGRNADVAYSQAQVFITFDAFDGNERSSTQKRLCGRLVIMAARTQLLRN